MKKLVPMLDSDGYFERPATSYESPLEPGVYHIPAGCIDAPLPDVPVGERAKWSGSGFVFEAIPLPPAPPVKTPEELRKERILQIERQRDMTLAAGLTWNGNKYHIDQTMIAALNGRLTLWQEGKIAVDAKLPVRRMDNVIELLDRAQHADLADALRLHGEQVYAASWVEKDKLK